jgi:3-carboxymethyl-3-hydroxy-acyl-[acp] synthase
MIVGSEPGILAIDPGASGYDSHEVMDTLRPSPDVEAGDSDLSLMSYLECLDRSFAMYRERVVGADIVDTFDYLVSHSPFAGMVKGAHRGLLRRAKSYPPDAIEHDFERRVADSLRYCTAVGNTYSAAVYLGLCSLVDHGDFSVARRVGFFSYGSGCASEFYSGVVPEGAEQQLAKLGIGRAIAERYALSMPEYELVSDLSLERMGAAENAVFDPGQYVKLYDSCLAGRGLLVLDRIHRFHREYR